MHSVTLTLHVQRQLGGLLLDQADHIEVAGGSHGGSKGDRQGELTASRHCPTARLKSEDGLPPCMTPHPGLYSMRSVFYSFMMRPWE